MSLSSSVIIDTLYLQILNTKEAATNNNRKNGKIFSYIYIYMTKLKIKI